MQIALFSDDVALDYPIRELILDQGHHCSIPLPLPLEELSQLQTEGLAGIDAIVLMSSDDPKRSADWVRTVGRQTDAAILVVGRCEGPRAILEIIRAGAEDYLPAGDSLPADLRAAFERVEERRRSTHPEAKTICLASASGGAGTSTIAVNLALLLARTCGGCGLIDLDLRRGDLARHLDVQPTRTIADLFAATDRIDRSLLEQALCPLPSGVSLLAAPPTLPESPRVTYDAVNRILETAKRMFPVLVIDLEDVFHLEQISVINRSDLLLLVTRADISSFWRTRNALEFMSQSSRVGERCRVVINQSDAAAALNPAQGARLLGVKDCWQVPHDPLHINVAINLGNPVVSESPTAPSSRALQRMASRLMQELMGTEAQAPDERASPLKAPWFSGRLGSWLGEWSRT